MKEKDKINEVHLKEMGKKAEKLAKEIGITQDVAMEFISANITDKSTLADLSVDEVIEDFKLSTLDTETISNAIMKARGLA
jgi:hypothetical protein